MKKVFTILVAAIMLASGMRVSIDRHYCGGQLAVTKISVTGKLASCGMETCEHGSKSGLSYEKNCCEDKLSYYSIFCNYVPENFRLLHPTDANNITATPAFNSAFVSKEPGGSDSQVQPPGNHLKPEVDLSLICNFRI